MSLHIQQQIKNNAADLRSYVEDLYDWEEQMVQKEKQKNSAGNTSQANVPIRGKADINVSGSISSKDISQPEQKNNQADQKNKDLIRDQNTIKDYYKAWDKFDVDKEIDDLEQKLKNEEQSKYENPYESMTSTKPRAAPRSQIKINSQRSAIIDINSLKDKANLYYQSLDFKKANEAYSECIERIKGIELTTNDEKALFTNIYSNRAMANIKLQEYASAELDCTNALLIDSTHIKSYLRRGTARKKLKKFKEAHQDFKQALQLQPDNKEAQRESALIDTALNEKKLNAQQALLLEGKGQDIYDKLEIEDISGSDLDSDDEDIEENNNDDEEDIPPVQNKFTRLSVIDKKLTHSDEKEVQQGNDCQENRKKSVLFSEQPIDIQLAQQTSYHKDEIPEHSILKNSHDLGHLVKNIDTKLIKHDDDEESKEEDGNSTVKFKGAEVPTMTFTPKHNHKPRNSILKNSPLVADQFHAQIKDIDGKIVHHHSRFKDQEVDNDNEEHQVHFKKSEIEPTKEHHHFQQKAQSPKKHILKHNLDDDREVEELHSKYFQPKHNPSNADEEGSFAYTTLKNIDGKINENHRRSPRHKPQVENIINDEVGNDDEDKKVHFGLVQNVSQVQAEVPKKEAKPRHSILKSQGSQIHSSEIQQVISIQEEVKSQEEKTELAIEQGKLKIKEVIIESSKADLNSSKFNTEWNNLKEDSSASFQYLQQIDPSQLVNIFKEGIELPVLNEIFQVFNDQYTKNGGEIIKRYIEQIPNLKRFKLSIGLLSSQDKDVIKSIVEKLKSDSILNNEESQKIKDTYKIK